MSQESIYPYVLADGSTLYYFKYRKSDGSAGTKRGFLSRREARRARQRMMAAVDRGEVRAARDSFAEFFDRWLTGRRPYLEDRTWRDYEVNGRARLKPRFGSMKLTALDEDAVRDWLADLIADQELSPKTLNNALAVLVTCLNGAVDRGLIARNPALRVKRLPRAHREMDYLRLYEIPRYLEACSDIYRPLAEILIATGMRISEALALTWSDIDLDRGVIVVYRSQKREGTGSTKGDRFRRVNISSRIVAMARDMKARQSEESATDLNRERVFRGPRGGQLTRSDVSRDMHKDALRGAGLRGSLRLHDLRHTAAATWLTLGKPLIYVQRQLGHSSIDTTEKAYGHLEEDYLASAAEEVDAAIWAGESSRSSRSLSPS